MNEQKKTSDRSTLHTVLLLVTSLVFSLIAWVYVTESTGEDIVRDFAGIKVVYDGEAVLRESQGLIVSDAYSNSVKVSVTGSRRVVSALDPSEIRVVVDLSGITRSGNYSLAPKVSFPSRVDSGGITLTVTSPGTVSFYIDKISRKTVDVVGVFNGSTAEGFSAKPLEFSPSTLILYGPEKSLAQIDHAYVEINRDEVEKSLSFDSTFQLVDADNKQYQGDEVTCDRDTVRVEMPVNAVKEVDLTVSFVSGGGASESNVKYKLEPDSILLSGDSETLEGVNSITLAKVDLASVDESMTETYKIVIPNDTENMSGIREATIEMELTGLSRRSISIPRSRITCSNVSEGFTAEVINSSLDNVILRGPGSTLRNISDVNVRAVADLTDFGAATGIVTVPVKITVDGAATVGAFGEYEAYVRVTRAEIEEDE